MCLGGKIAPIFYNTMEDAGALPIELDVSQMEMGDVVELRPYEGKALKDGKVIAEFQVKSDVLFDEVRAGGRIPLIIGRGLTAKAREALGLAPSTLFRLPHQPADSGKGFARAEDGRPRLRSAGRRAPGHVLRTEDDLGRLAGHHAMTRDELKDLACLGFSADLVMQSFCHTAAYPKPVDVKTHQTLPNFISTRGGIALRPGDGVIHSWLNRCCPTPSAPAAIRTRASRSASASRQVRPCAFAAATGTMPLDMPESVLVRFKGKMQPGVTLRDLVNAIPLYAIKQHADGRQARQEEHSRAASSKSKACPT